MLLIHHHRRRSSQLFPIAVIPLSSLFLFIMATINLHQFTLSSALTTTTSKDNQRRLNNHRIVKTKYGSLRGLLVNYANLPASSEMYLGIPYASPPVGQLRFMPPVTPAVWQGVRNATTFGPVCPQKFPDIRNETLALQRMTSGRLRILKQMQNILRNQSEDCLYLNIYAPAECKSILFC